MSNDFTTIDLQTESFAADISASGSWSKSFVKRPEASWWRLVQLGVLLSIAASPATAVPDYWFFERRRDPSATVRWVLEAIGQAISRMEALEIARQILNEAERERLVFAEWEAKGGIQWELGE